MIPTHQNTTKCQKAKKRIRSLFTTNSWRNKTHSNSQVGWEKPSCGLGQRISLFRIFSWDISSLNIAKKKLAVSHMHMSKTIGSNFTITETLTNSSFSERRNTNQTGCSPHFAFPTKPSVNAMILKWNLVCFQHPKCLYLHPENADANCLLQPWGKYQLIVAEKTVESLIMLGPELLFFQIPVSVAIVTCEGWEQLHIT